MIVDAKLYRELVDICKTAAYNPLLLNQEYAREVQDRAEAADAPKPQRKRISNAQFNNDYVRSDRGHKAEKSHASKDSLRGTRAGRTNKVGTPQ